LKFFRGKTRFLKRNSKKSIPQTVEKCGFLRLSKKLSKKLKKGVDKPP